MVWEAHRNRVLTHEVEATGEGNPFTIFFISDTHNRRINEKMLAPYKGKVDAVIIGGDFVDGRTSVEKMKHNMRVLTQLAPTYFIWGNNDREVNAQLFTSLLEQFHITTVLNDSVVLRDKLRLCGIDFNGTTTMIEQAVKKCEADEQVIFVSHDPYRFNKVTKFVEPLLFLAGHLHGGQIRIGRFGMFQKGSFVKQFNTYQLISNGYGTTLLPFRLGAKAEAHLVHIRYKHSK